MKRSNSSNKNQEQPQMHLEFKEQIQNISIPLPSHNITPQQSRFALIQLSTTKIFCRGCRKDINYEVCILINRDYLCVGCFAKLDIIPPDYIVITKNRFQSIYDSNWSGMHQLLFLQFLQKYHFGNWSQIKHQMEQWGLIATEQEIQDHFYGVYFNPQGNHIPKLPNRYKLKEKRNEAQLSSKINRPSPFSKAPLDIIDQFEDIGEYYANKFQRNHQIDEYNEKRNEFRVEYDKDAERMIEDLQFRDDDCQEEIEIKFQLLEQYNRRIKKRQLVKEFVLQHRLLDENYQKQLENNRNDYQKESHEELKCIARFSNLKEYNQLVKKWGFSKQLKSIIQGIRNLRRSFPSGFNNLDEYLNSHIQEAKPRKREINENSMKGGRKFQQILERNFKLTKRDFQNLITNLQNNGKKAVYKNVQAVILENKLLI